MSEKKNVLLYSAVEIAKNGFAVVPVNMNSKIPAVQWKGIAEGEIEKVVDYYSSKEYNISIRTGRNITNNVDIILIDLDRGHADGIDGVENFEKLLESLGITHDEAYDTYCEKTPSGGIHLYYKAPFGSDIKSVSEAFGEEYKGIDVKGESGISIVAPSIIDGKAYESLNDRKFIVDDINEIPSKLLESLPKKGFNNTLSSNNKSGNNAASKDDAASEESSNKSIYDGFHEGNRNKWLLSYAGHLHNRLPEINYDIMYKFLNTVNLYAAKANNCEPLPDSEVISISKSAEEWEKKPEKDNLYDKCIIVINGVKLRAKPDRNGNPLYAISGVDNVCRILANDSNFANSLAYDVRNQMLSVIKKVPWDDDTVKYPRIWTETDTSYLIRYIDFIYEINSKKYIYDCLNIAGRNNQVNPVKEYMESLKWDGKERAETLFIDFLGADDNPAIREFTRLFLRGACRRGCKPGCKMDYTLALYGGQGIGKSELIRRLGHREEWVNENFSKVGDNREIVSAIRGKWICEEAENVASQSAKSIEADKAFRTLTHISYRPYYGRMDQTYAVGCVYIKTTNKSVYLTDPTGNRRILPINCSRRSNTVNPLLFSNEIEEYINQVWAEVYNWEKEDPDFALILSKEGLKAANELREDHTIDDPRVSVCEKWIYDKKRIGYISKGTKITPNEIVVDALMLDEVCIEGRRAITDIRTWLENNHEFKPLGRKLNNGRKLYTFEYIGE